MDEERRRYDLKPDDRDATFAVICEACGHSVLFAGDPPGRMGNLDTYLHCTKCGASLGTLRSLLVKDRLATGAPLKKRTPDQRHRKRRGS